MFSLRFVSPAIAPLNELREDGSPCNTPEVLFVRLFDQKALDSVQPAISKAAKEGIIAFLDTPPNRFLEMALGAALSVDVGMGEFMGVVRDHHSLPAGQAPRNSREEELEAARNRCLYYLGDDSRLVDRSVAPGCSSLVDFAEFSSAALIIADADPDGLLSVLKAVGIYYEGMDQDGAILDGPPAGKSAETLTQRGWALARCWAALPTHTGDGSVREKATQELFKLFGLAAGETMAGESALRILEERAKEFEAMVEEANHVANSASEIFPGVFYVDVMESVQKMDLATFARVLEGRGAIVTVTRKADGPIAPHHGGCQVSLAVSAPWKEKVNLSHLKCENTPNTPEGGQISHTTFLYHCSAPQWEGRVGVALSALVAAAKEVSPPRRAAQPGQQASPRR